MSLYHTTLRNGEDLFLVKHTHPKSSDEDNSKLHVWKTFYKADCIFIKGGLVYYCEKIEDAEVLEYIKYSKQTDLAKNEKEEIKKPVE